MKDIIEKLLRAYFEIGILINDMIVTENKGRTTINVFKNLAPAKWGLYEQGTYNNQTGRGI